MPWGEMMRHALAMGIAPEAFWRLSLKEWRWLTGGQATPGLGREALAAMMARWPDGEGEGRGCQ